MRIDKAKTREPIQQNEKISSQQRVSAYTESYKGEYYNIDVTKLIPFKNQARKSIDQKSLEELAQTIKDHGIRQPLTIISSEEQEGKYEIVSGERRWRAAQSIGVSKVPCIILHDREAAEEIALIENIQRKNLHPLELMHGFQNLLDRKICKNQQEIADKIGISRTVVVETLGLSKLPAPTQELLLTKQIKSRDVLRLLLKSPETKHEEIILNEEKNKEKENKNKPQNLNKKNKIISIYLKSEEVVIDEDNQMTLTTEQKSQITDYLQNLLKRIAN